MKLTFRYIYSLLLILGLTGCTDNYDSNGSLEPSLSIYWLGVSKTDFSSYRSSQYSETFTVESLDTPWKFTEVPNWIALTPASGKTSSDVTMNVEENKNVDSARTAIFYLTSNVSNWDYSRAISVSQPNALPYLSVSETSVLFENKVYQQKIDINANCTWNATCSASWVSLNADVNAGILTISVTPNSGDDYRAATVYVNYGVTYVTITIKQSPASISSSVETLTYENVASKYDITIDAESDWTSAVSDSWISVNPDKGKAGKSTVSIEVTPNTSITSRKGYVSFKSGSRERLQIAIEQEGLYIEADSKVKFTSLAESKKLTIHSNTKWEVATKPDWITVSQESGEGDGEITLTTLDNPNTTSRRGDLWLGQEGLSINCCVSILQSGKTLSTNVGVLELSDKACQSTFEIISDAKWTASQTANWFTSTPTSGNGNATITVSAEANNSAEERTGRINYAYIDKVWGIDIHQMAKYMTIDNQAFVFDSKGGTHTIDLSTNDEWTAEIENNPSWLKLSKSSGSGSATLTLTADDNASVNSRSAVVLINTKYSQSIRILVSQEPRFLTVSTQSLLMFASGGLSETVSIETNGTYDIKGESSWFTVYQYAGNTFKVNATQNVSSEMRSGKIIISLTNLKEGSLSIELPVIQAGKGGSFIINGFPEDVNWDSNGNGYLNISVKNYTSDKNWDNSINGSLNIKITDFKTDNDWNI